MSARRRGEQSPRGHGGRNCQEGLQVAGKGDRDRRRSRCARQGDEETRDESEPTPARKCSAEVVELGARARVCGRELRVRERRQERDDTTRGEGEPERIAGSGSSRAEHRIDARGRG